MFTYPEKYRVTAHLNNALNTAEGEPGIFTIPLNSTRKWRHFVARCTAIDDARGWEKVTFEIFILNESKHIGDHAGRAALQEEIQEIRNLFWNNPNDRVIQFFVGNPSRRTVELFRHRTRTSELPHSLRQGAQTSE